MPKWPCWATVTSKWQFKVNRDHLWNEISLNLAAKTYTWYKFHVHPCTTFTWGCIQTEIDDDRISATVSVTALKLSLKLPSVRFWFQPTWFRPIFRYGRKWNLVSTCRRRSTTLLSGRHWSGSSFVIWPLLIVHPPAAILWTCHSSYLSPVSTHHVILWTCYSSCISPVWTHHVILWTC